MVEVKSAEIRKQEEDYLIVSIEGAPDGTEGGDDTRESAWQLEMRTLREIGARWRTCHVLLRMVVKEIFTQARMSKVTL